MCVCVLAADALCWLQHGDLWSSRADCWGRLTSWSFSTSLCRPQGDNIFTQPHLEGCDGDTVLVFWVYWTQFFFLFSCLWVSARRQLESSHHWQVVKKKRSVQVCKSPRCGWSRFMVLSLEAQKCFFVHMVYEKNHVYKKFHEEDGNTYRPDGVIIIMCTANRRFTRTSRWSTIGFYPCFI